LTHGNGLTEEREALGELPRQVAVAGSSDPPVELVEHGLPDHQLACDVHVLSLPLRTSRREEHIGVLAVNDEIQHLWLRLNR